MLADSNIKWDIEADIVVVGYGGSGAVAAITAHDCQANVLIVEKQEAESHCPSTSMAGGTILSPSSSEEAFTYVKALYDPNGGPSWTEPAVLLAWAEYTVENQQWIRNVLKRQKLKSVGTVPEMDIPGGKSINAFKYPGMGYTFYKDLCREVKARNIRVMHATSALNLLTNAQGDIIGIKAVHFLPDGKKEVNLYASRAVILTCGGFQYNEALKLQYLKMYPFYGHGSPASTGDGIAMAQEVGADLWHMNCCSGRLMAKFPDFPVAFSLLFDGMPHKRDRIATTQKPAGFLWVDSLGKRFTCEEAIPHSVHYETGVYDSKNNRWPRLPSYWIFDSTRLSTGPLVRQSIGAAGKARLYRWSKDNSKEIKRGWIVTGSTVRELSNNIGVCPDTLSQSVSDYNKYCKQGFDPEFGRKSVGLIPINKSPFCAVKLWPCGPTTHGGPRRNARAQVVTPSGKQIPGLYAAGELGSIYGLVYVGSGGFLAECIAFGRIAGENASKENRKPR